MGAARLKAKLRLPLHALLPPPPAKKLPSTTTSPTWRPREAVLWEETRGDTKRIVVQSAEGREEGEGGVLTNGCKFELSVVKGQEEGSCVHSLW